MKCSNFAYRVSTALALAAAVVASPARADLVLLGSDYFKTEQPTFVSPLGPLAGLPIGPLSTDTIVQRQADCALSLATIGSNCTIPIEVVALSLVSTGNPAVLVRESPTLASTGSMTMTSDGSGTGGTFTSFFDVFFELSIDGGVSWNPQTKKPFTSNVIVWTTIERQMLVGGLLGDQNANLHKDKGGPKCPTGMACVDFYTVGVALHDTGGGKHSVRATPEPGSLALAGLALTAMIGLRRRSTRREGVRAEQAPLASSQPA